MKLKQLEELFEKYEGEFLEFDRVENKLSKRADLHAFILLDKLVPGEEDMIISAEHDEYVLSIDAACLAKVATEEDVIDLIRCGVSFEDDYFWMFA